MLKKIVIFSIVIVLILGCENSNVIESKNYKSKADKIEALKEYYKIKSEIIDTEYRIFDVNINNRTIPGPTDRNYKIIIKIKLDDFDKWDSPNDITSIPINYNWAIELLEGNENFDLSGVNVHYTNKNRDMIIFKETGVVLISYVQH